MKTRIRPLMAILILAAAEALAAPAWASPLDRVLKIKIDKVGRHLKEAREFAEQGNEGRANNELGLARRELDQMEKRFGNDHPEAVRLSRAYEDGLRDCKSLLSAAPQETGGAPQTGRAGRRRSGVRQQGRRVMSSDEVAANLAEPIDSALEKALAESEKAIEMKEDKLRLGKAKGALEEIRKAEDALNRLAGKVGQDHEEVHRLRKKVEEARSHCETHHGKLLAAEFAGMEAPQNVYRGSDRGELERQIRKEWTSFRPQDEILGIRFDQKDWFRQEIDGSSRRMEGFDLEKEDEDYVITEKTRDLENEMVDYKWVITENQLRVSVVVKKNPKVAAIYHVYYNKRIKSGKTKIRLGGEDDLYFAADMPLANFK